MSLSRTGDRERHDRTLELAATAIDFDLTRAETVELEAHLATCPTCARRMAALRADARVLSRPLVLPALARADAAVYAAIARQPARPQRLLLLVAAALLLVALLGTAAVGASLLRDRQTLPTTVVPNPSAPVADASPGPDASPSVVGETWATMDFPEDSMDGFIEDATFAGTDLVAVGNRSCVPNPDDPTNCYAAAWTAAPGQSWTRAANQAGLEVGLGQGLELPGSGIQGVVDGPAGLVAIGFDNDPLRSSCRVAPCTTGPGVWRSPDGRTWERALVDFGPSTIDTYNLPISDIAAGPTGYVMVGHSVDYAALPPSSSARATAWASPDGVTWTRAIDTADMDVGPCVDTGEAPDCGGMRAVVAVGSGFLAVGQTRTGPEPNRTSRPAAWTSADGLTWTRSDAGLDFEGLLVDVTVGGPGVVAIGTICQPTCVNVAPGVAATSRDGSAWTFSHIAGSTGLERVASTGGQVFAIGMAPQELDAQELLLWRSDDGVAWRRVTGVPSIPDVRGVGLAAADDRLVAFGWAAGGVKGFKNFSYLSPAPGSPTAPTPSPSPSGPVASIIDPVIVMRVNISSDTGGPRYPSLTVYRDGTVLNQNGRVTRLTPNGMERLTFEATNSGLFVESGDFGHEPGYVGGGADAVIEIRRGDEVIRRSTPLAMAQATRDEAERILALAERLIDHESWLPADAWAAGPATATTYAPTHFLLQVTVEAAAGPPGPLDVADVVWPLAGRIDTFGVDFGKSPFSSAIARCGVIGLSDGLAVERALEASPLDGQLVAGQTSAALAWAAADRRVTVRLVSPLPGEQLECTADTLQWP